MPAWQGWQHQRNVGNDTSVVTFESHHCRCCHHHRCWVVFVIFSEAERELELEFLGELTRKLPKRALICSWPYIEVHSSRRMAKLSKLWKFASNKLPQFVLATDTLCMGYEYLFQKITRQQLLNMLISTVSILQILVLEIFSKIFINTALNLNLNITQDQEKRSLLWDGLADKEWIVDQKQRKNIQQSTIKFEKKHVNRRAQLQRTSQTQNRTINTVMVPMTMIPPPKAHPVDWAGEQGQ